MSGVEGHTLTQRQCVVVRLESETGSCFDCLVHMVLWTAMGSCYGVFRSLAGLVEVGYYEQVLEDSYPVLSFLVHCLGNHMLPFSETELLCPCAFLIRMD